MRRVFTNARILTGGVFLDDHALILDGARIAAIVPAADARIASLPTEDLCGGQLVPGFIDTQVNGGAGVLFNDAPTVDTIRAIGHAHRAFGTTGFLPTLISDDIEVVEAAIKSVEAAIAARVPGVLGIHLEGPFLNPKRCGIHDPKHLKKLSEAFLPHLKPVRGGATLVTLAPEQTTPEVIGALVSQGVIVAAGHTNATFAEMATALRAGVRGFTHLFNAMSPLTAREPGVVGAALLDPDSWCGIIVDGHHVDPMSLRVAMRCKRPERLMLVTDAMPPVGTEITAFALDGRPITVEGGVCRAADGTLAGTVLDLASAVRNCVRLLGCSVEIACRMASEFPADFLNLRSLGRIAAGHCANLALLDADLRVQRTWIDGQES
jgi:N-acetylglucosamine-6-phosphate deacetylase